MKAKKKLRRLWSILLALVMVVGLLPTGQIVYAAEPSEPSFDGSTLYANGFPILIEAGKTSGTTIKYDRDKTAPYDYETVITENNANALTVYAGGNAVDIATGSILMTGGNVENIYGGGFERGDTVNVDSAYITINGGNVNTIYGGGSSRYSEYGGSTVVNTATITVAGGVVNTLYASASRASVYADCSVRDAKILVTGGRIVNIFENAGYNQSVGNVGWNTVTVTSFVITGGSIASSNLSLTPTNGGETPLNVAKNEITLKDKDEENTVPNESISTLTTDTGYAYGMNDVKTDANGKIYVWLPDGVSVLGAESASGDKYVTGSASGVLKRYEVYTVSFDANGGTGTMEDVTKVVGDYTLPANSFTAPEGKHFKCWSVDGVEKAVGETINVAANTTIKAIWETTTYTVSFDANGGTGTMADVTEVVGNYTLPANGFTAPEGKQFKCWSVDGVEKAVGDSITVDANTTVTAVWEAIKYNVDGTDSDSAGTPVPAAKGKVLTDEQGTSYIVTKSDAKDGEVAFAKSKSGASGTVKILDQVTVDGITYKVTAIEENAFKNDKSIAKVSIGNNVTVIGKNAFSGCKKLKDVKLGAAVTTIGDKAFYKCTSLTSITIPAEVTKIGKSAFEGCKKLKKITVKSTNLKSVGKKALKGIHAKAKIKVPKSKLTKYKSLFKNKGQGKKVKVTK